MKSNFLKIIIFPLLYFWIPSILFSQEDYEVREIGFVGNQYFSSGVLQEKMETYSISGFQKTFLRRKPFKYSAELLKSDLVRIRRFYQREGFLNVQLNLSNLETNADKRTIKITIKINEGNPIQVSDVGYRLQGETDKNKNELETIIKSILTKLNLVKGDRFRDQFLESDESMISKKFTEAGYAYVRTRSELDLNESGRTVNIQWMIDPGPKCVFGKTEVEGNENVSNALILRQLKFEEGQVYNEDLLEKSQQQIFSLGMFYIVTVKAILSEEQHPVLPVEMQIREAPRLTTRFGVGYGSEDKFRAFADAQRLGFLGGARRLRLFLKHSGLEPYNISLWLTQPHFLTPKTTIALNPFIRREEEPGFSVNRLGLNVPLTYQITRYLNGSVTYYLEKVDQDTIRTISEEIDNAPPSLYNKSGFILGLTRDSSTPIFYPTGGMFVSATFKLNGLLIKSDYHYTKLLIDARQYNKLLGIVAAYRVKIGGINSTDENKFIPSEDRFYSGGSMSVRGWGRSELGPKDNNGIPIGGKSILEASLEIRYPIWRLFSGVVFTDFGNIWIPAYTYKLDELRYSVGFGLRVATPIGPIRLDIAWPIKDQDKKTQIHINVGQAF
jgi:outer membrane protein insertion porin family